MAGVQPSKLSKTLPEFRWVDPKTLLVEDEYQRSLSDRSVRLIRQIVERFDWSRIKPVICAKDAQGRLCVIDGQHTAIAAVSHGQIEKVPAVVVAAQSVKERAAAFISHNEDRINITPMQMYYSALASGDEVAVAVDQACKAAGVTIKRTQPAKWSVGDTVAIVSIRRLVEKRGIGSATRVLKALRTAQRAPIVSNEVRAVGAVLFDKELGWQGEIFDLVTVIRSKSADEWTRAVETKRKGDDAPPVWLAVAQAWLRQLKRGA